MILKKNKGFTLVEIIVAMAIIALLIALIVGAIVLVRRTATETAHRANAYSLIASVERRFSQTKEWCVNHVDWHMDCTDDPTWALHGYVDFDWAALSHQLDVKLNSACEDGRNSAPWLRKGGGRMILTKDGYRIAPANADCNADLEEYVVGEPPEFQ